MLDRFYQFLDTHYFNYRLARRIIGGTWELWRVKSLRFGDLDLWMQVGCVHTHYRYHELGYTFLEREIYSGNLFDRIMFIDLAKSDRNHAN